MSYSSSSSAARCSCSPEGRFWGRLGGGPGVGRKVWCRTPEEDQGEGEILQGFTTSTGGCVAAPRELGRTPLLPNAFLCLHTGIYHSLQVFLFIFCFSLIPLYYWDLNEVFLNQYAISFVFIFVLKVFQSYLLSYTQIQDSMKEN